MAGTWAAILDNKSTGEKTTKDRTKGKTACMHGLEDNTVKMSALPKAIYSINNPYQTPKGFFFFFWQKY